MLICILVEFASDKELKAVSGLWPAKPDRRNRFFLCETMTEEEKSQTIEVIQFARSHRKELKSAEQWLNSIDEGMVEAWFLSERGNRDWRKILFLEWLFRDEKLYEHEFDLDDFDARDWCENQDKQFAANFARLNSYGPWRTDRHPVFYVVHGALEEGKRTAIKHTEKLLCECRNSDDFTSVVWYGKEYTFNKTQALCVKYLWEQWENGTPSLSEKTIGDKIGSASENYRIISTFRINGKTHPAWGVMIRTDGKGTFKLAEPHQEKSSKK